ncbi:MAG: tripartite tricarboxylate transporter substrate binding protein [Burkholderiales bacterium]|nr:tripartite tricarboxylate transporter substrate binding protein [Burkholderiales bacterium]
MRLIVPFVPGGGTDSLARIINKKLSDVLGQQVVIDNRAGAQGNVGTALGAKARADGYTVTLVIHGTLTINPHMYSDTGYDALKDFAAVSRGTTNWYVLVAHPSVPVKTLKDVVDLGKAKPGSVTFGTSASGPQLVGELLKMTTATGLVHVPYKGAGQAVIALLGGQTNLMISSPAAIVPHVKNGKARAIAFFAKERNEALPDVPTALEQGFADVSDVPEWYGFAVPAGTPAAAIKILNSAFTAALTDPESQKGIRVLGMTPSPSTPEEFAKQIRADYERWGKVVKAAGVKID